MIPNALLIQTAAIDFRTLLGMSQQALGCNLSQAIDASPIKRSEAERFLICLAALRGEQVESGLPPGLFAHVSLGTLVAADDRDMIDILQTCSGMPFVVADTQVRGVQLAVITGTLAQWRDAVRAGSAQGNEFNVRQLFNRVMRLVEEAVGFVWKDCEARHLPDTTYYLEDKR